MYLVTNALSEQLGSQYPFWQAPLPFDLISADMSGRISAQGAHGIIRIAAHDTRDSLTAKIDAYRNNRRAINPIPSPPNCCKPASIPSRSPYNAATTSLTCSIPPSLPARAPSASRKACPTAKPSPSSANRASSPSPSSATCLKR